MSDDGTSGGGTVSAPAESSGASAPASLPEVKERVLSTLATQEDAGDFIAESNAQKAEERGEDLTPYQRGERTERFKKAIEIARQDGSEPLPQTATEDHAGSSQHDKGGDRDQVQRQIDYARADAKFEMRAERFEAQAPDFKEVLETFQYIPAHQHVAEVILKSDVGPQIAYCWHNFRKPFSN